MVNRSTRVFPLVEKHSGALVESEVRLIPPLKKGGAYASLVHLMAFNMQQYGLVMGALYSVLLPFAPGTCMLQNKMYFKLFNGISYHLAFARPQSDDLEMLAGLIQDGLINVKDMRLEQTPFKQIKRALAHLQLSGSQASDFLLLIEN